MIIAADNIPHTYLIFLPLASVGEKKSSSQNLIHFSDLLKGLGLLCFRGLGKDRYVLSLLNIDGGGRIGN